VVPVDQDLGFEGFNQRRRTALPQVTQCSMEATASGALTEGRG
jgi:hypothetical protein